MYIDQAQIEAAINFLGPAILDYTVNSSVASRCGNRDPNMSPHSAYPCLGDACWVAIAVSDEEEWHAFCKVIGEPEWTMDPRFSIFSNR